MKKVQKHFTAVSAAAAMLFAAVLFTAALFTACGEADTGSISLGIGGGGGKPPPSEELKLKSLTVYYSEDEEKKNLVGFSQNKGDYTITDVVNSKGTLTVEAEALKTGASTAVSWNRVKTKGQGEAAEGLVEMTNIPAPGVEGGQNLPVVITVTVRNGGQSYPYTITAKAPGVDSSLEYLSFRYSDNDLTPLADWEWDNGAGFWNGELLYD
ncbi:MAG: hypothetical protein LBJ35_04230, partial [Spirochaetaceae bacterium]|nr:hypothetical protein [Spirochaetaceae bacterium]